MDLALKALSIFRPCQLFSKLAQAEAGVDTLIEDSPQETLTLDDQDVVNSIFQRSQGSSQPGRTPADDNQVVVTLHVSFLPGTSESPLRSLHRQGLRSCVPARTG